MCIRDRFAGDFTFTINNRSGLLFQLGGTNLSDDHRIIGVPDMNPGNLGRELSFAGGLATGGFLASLKGGGDNDLFKTASVIDGNTATNPADGNQNVIPRGNALNVVDAAIEQVSDIRAFLGAFVAQEVEPNIRSLDVAIQNLTSSESDIRDLDFASETAEFTRSQVLFQAGVSVMASANLIPQTVLQLLQ